MKNDDDDDDDDDDDETVPSYMRCIYVTCLSLKMGARCITEITINYNFIMNDLTYKFTGSWSLLNVVDNGLLLVLLRRR